LIGKAQVDLVQEYFSIEAVARRHLDVLADLAGSARQ
jgi:hypothetical protein